MSDTDSHSKKESGGSKLDDGTVDADTAGAKAELPNIGDGVQALGQKEVAAPTAAPDLEQKEVELKQDDQPNTETHSNASKATVVQIKNDDTVDSFEFPKFQQAQDVPKTVTDWDTFAKKQNLPHYRGVSILGDGNCQIELIRLALHCICGIDKTVQALRNELHDEVKKMMAEISNSTDGKPWDVRVVDKINKYRVGKECKLEHIKQLRRWKDVEALEIAFLLIPIVKDINFVIYAESGGKLLHEMFSMFRENAHSFVAIRSSSIDHYTAYVPQHLEEKCRGLLPRVQVPVSTPDLVIPVSKVDSTNNSTTNGQMGNKAQSSDDGGFDLDIGQKLEKKRGSKMRLIIGAIREFKKIREHSNGREITDFVKNGAVRKLKRFLSKYKGSRAVLQEDLFKLFLAEFIRADGEEIVEEMLLEAITDCKLTDKIGKTLLDEISKSSKKYAHPKTVRALGVLVKHFDQSVEEERFNILEGISTENKLKEAHSVDMGSVKVAVSESVKKIADVRHRVKVMEQLKDEKCGIWETFLDYAITWQPQDEEYNKIMYHMCQICNEFRCNAKAYPCGHIPVCAVCRYEHVASSATDRTICPQKDCGKKVKRWEIVSQYWDDNRLFELILNA